MERVVVRLPFRPPLHVDQLFGHLVETAVPGVEEWRDGAYRRTLRLPLGHGIVALQPGRDEVVCELHLTDPQDLTVAIDRCRWLLDLDTDPAVVDTHLSSDPVLAPLVAAVPGRRVPRAVDGPEMAIRAVLGQQISTAAARTHAHRLVLALGEPLDEPAGGLTHLFPAPGAIVEAPAEVLAMPASRRHAVRHLAAALASGDVDLDPGTDGDGVRAQLAALPGIGPWTVETIAMRALGDPDAFVPTDLGVRAAARQLGLGDTPRALVDRAQRWRPWRAYVVQHLWGSVDHAINRLPRIGR